MKNKKIISTLFTNYPLPTKAFTPMSTVEGDKFLSGALKSNCVRYGAIDISDEQHPDTIVNATIVKDITEKLLGCLLIDNLDITDEIFSHVMNEDLGLMFLADKDLNLTDVFFFDLFDYQNEPTHPIYTSNTVNFTLSYFLREMVQRH
jgi:hypothetical protein